METEQIQPLATEFDLNGYHFHQLRRHGLVAMFEKRKEDHFSTHYEVVEIQVYPPRECFGKMLPERESMPGNEQWGRAGWSFTDRAMAEKAYLARCKD